MSNRWRGVAVVLCLTIAAVFATAQEKASGVKIPAGAKVFISPINDGFDTYLKAAIRTKKVPIVIVENKDDAQYILTGTSESRKAGAAKKIIMGSWHSDEQASIQVSEVASGAVVFAYSANKQNSAHGKKSTAESCAKHLKEEIAGK